MLMQFAIPPGSCCYYLCINSSRSTWTRSPLAVMALKTDFSSEESISLIKVVNASMYSPFDPGQ